MFSLTFSRKMCRFTAMKSVPDCNFGKMNCVSQAGEACHVLEIFTIPPVPNVIKISAQVNKKRKQNNHKDNFFPSLSLKINSQQKALLIFYLFMNRNSWKSLLILKLLVATNSLLGRILFISLKMSHCGVD